MGVAVTREDIIQQFTFMMKEADGYIDMLDWNNLLDKNKKIADIFTRRGEIPLCNIYRSRIEHGQ